jgi:exosortase B
MTVDTPARLVPGPIGNATPRGEAPGLWLWPLALGLAAIVLPTWWELAHTVWPSDEQGHGPIILAVALWLIYSARDRLVALPWAQPGFGGWALFAAGCLFFAFGRSQSILTFEMAAHLMLLGSLLWLLKGRAGMRLLWFPLFFMLFMVPLPEALVAAVTSPLKQAVSAVASSILFHLGYPVGRAGVILMVGQYQLLVADACAGLTSMFTLEAIGMLYMQLRGYRSKMRNTLLALLLIPIAFLANVVRVIVLVLVTYHFGDEAGQGFVHGFAGILLFVVATMAMMVVDGLLGRFIPEPADRAPATGAAR